MKILDKYILNELMGPFLFGLGTFTILFMAVESLSGVAKLISESGLSIWLALEYLLLRIPMILIFTMPMASLLSCLLAYGRMSGDSELTALRASGVSFTRIAIPSLVFFALLSFFAQVVNDKIVPQATHRALNILFLSQAKTENLQNNFVSSNRQLSSGEQLIYYVHRWELSKLTIHGLHLHYYQGDELLRDVFVKEAVWKEGAWQLSNAQTTFYQDGSPSSYSTSPSGWTTLGKNHLPKPDMLVKRKLREEEMNREQLKQWIAQDHPPQDDLKAMSKHREAEVTLHQKISIPWTSFVFATFAIPLGVRPQRSSKSVGLGLSLVFILLYYVFMTIGMIAGKGELVSPFIGAWLPNIIFGTLGFFLLRSASKA